MTRIHRVLCNRRTYSSLFRKLSEELSAGQSKESIARDIRKLEETLTELKKNETIKRTWEVLDKSKKELARQNEQIVKDIKQQVSGGISVAAAPLKMVGSKIRPYIQTAANSPQATKVYDTIEKVNKNIEESTDVLSYGGVRSKSSRENIQRAMSDSSAKAARSDPQGMSANESETRVVVKEPSFSERCISRVRGAFSMGTYLSAALDNARASNSVVGFFVREFVDSISAKVGSLFAENETAACTRVLKAHDPDFDTSTFLKLARDMLIPNIIEAILCRDLPALKTMCSEAAYNLISASFNKEARYQGELLDIRNVELLAGRVIEDRPILVLSLHAQQIASATAPDGTAIEGDKERISHLQYILALSPREAKPSAEWVLVDISFRENSY